MAMAVALARALNEMCGKQGNLLFRAGRTENEVNLKASKKVWCRRARAERERRSERGERREGRAGRRVSCRVVSCCPPDAVRGCRLREAAFSFFCLKMASKDERGRGGSGGTSNNVIRVCVVGDEGVGKTSLIVAAATDAFNPTPAVLAAKGKGHASKDQATQHEPLPPTRIPVDLLPDLVPLIVTDTSPHYEYREELEKAVHRSDVVVVCYTCGDSNSLARVGTYWLPELRHMAGAGAGAGADDGDKPVLLVGCKEDKIDLQDAPSAAAAKLNLRDEEDDEDGEADDAAGDASGEGQGAREEAAAAGGSYAAEMEQQLSLLIDQWKEVEVCLQCSAKRLSNVVEVFSHAQKAVLHPTGPLYDPQTGQLKVRMLLRI